MQPRILLAAILLAAPLVLPAAAANAAPRHHRAAHVSIATWRHPVAPRPVHGLRAGHAPRSRLAAALPRHHPLSRGS